MLTGKYRQGEKSRAGGFGGKVFQAENSPQRSMILDAVLEIAGEIVASAGQVAIAWASTHGSIPIIEPRSKQQLTDNLGALSVNLTHEQLCKLDAVSSVSVRPIHLYLG